MESDLPATYRLDLSSLGDREKNALCFALVIHTEYICDIHTVYICVIHTVYTCATVSLYLCTPL